MSRAVAIAEISAQSGLAVTGPVWRRYSYVPHPDSSGCPAAWHLRFPISEMPRVLWGGVSACGGPSEGTPSTLLPTSVQKPRRPVANLPHRRARAPQLEPNSSREERITAPTWPESGSASAAPAPPYPAAAPCRLRMPEPAAERCHPATYAPEPGPR